VGMGVGQIGFREGVRVGLRVGARDATIEGDLVGGEVVIMIGEI